MSDRQTNIRIGVIGGSGLYEMAALTDREEVSVPTPFGDPSSPYVVGMLNDRRVAFLARHGEGHRLMPSELNFRANIFGFKTLGVEWILSASAVGSLKEEYRPLDIVLPDQFLDRTRGRPMSGSPTRSVRCSAASLSMRLLPPVPVSTAVAPTCAWKVRSSRRWPSPGSIVRGVWTSSG